MGRLPERLCIQLSTRSFEGRSYCKTDQPLAGRETDSSGPAITGHDVSSKGKSTGQGAPR